MGRENFYKTLAENNIQLTATQQQQFETYADLLIEWNQKMNLTAILNKEEIYEKHFLDSILPSFSHTFHGTICDVGAGAGFPSIPLKIVYPNLDVTIVEPLGKRIQFLKHLTIALGIEVNLENKRSEDYVLEKRAYFDIVCARAVANLTLLAEICIPLVKENGRFITLKGQKAQEELVEASYALEELGVQLKNQSQYYLNGAMRTNFEFIKVKKTPLKYPRHFSKIKKSPLVRRVK